MPKSNWGRVVAIFWMFTGIAFVAYFTATVTASMTVQQLQGDINGPDDLIGKRIATVSGSTSEKFLRERGIQVRGFAQFEGAADALQENQVQAVVFDAPVLLYYMANKGKDKVHVVGPIFRRENYGIAFPAGSPWRRRVNYALLKLKEEGTYESLYNKWFGQSEE
jgi:polar amino acid transport system substrate-binding protein